MWFCCVQLRQFAGKAMLLAWSLSQVVAIGGSVCGVVCCGGVVWCGISSSSKKGKEKLRRHLLAEAGGQLTTPHTVNKKSILFNFNDEKEKENFGGSEAKRFCLEEYILSKNICAAF